MPSFPSYGKSKIQTLGLAHRRCMFRLHPQERNIVDLHHPLRTKMDMILPPLSSGTLHLHRMMAGRRSRSCLGRIGRRV